MLQAINEELAEQQQRWGWIEELLATQTEILHELLRFNIGLYSKKGSKSLPRLNIPRPGREEVVVEKVTIHTYRRALLGGGNPDGF